MTAVIEASGITKRFGEHEVLKGISFSAQKGNVVSVIGSSGSGKSTLLRCMNFLEQPSGGALQIADEHFQLTGDNGMAVVPDPQQLRRLRSKVTMVFQQFNLWPHMTVLENVIEAPIRVKKRRRRKAVDHGKELLDKVGMWEKRNEYPAFLSGGQQQRVSIARALAMDPEVLLFDEPTSALDPELVNEVLSVIHDLVNEGRTMMLVTHELNFARDVSSNVLFLHQGEIEAAGTPRDIFENSDSERCRQFVSSVY